LFCVLWNNKEAKLETLKGPLDMSKTHDSSTVSMFRAQSASQRISHRQVVNVQNSKQYNTGTLSKDILVYHLFIRITWLNLISLFEKPSVTQDQNMYVTENSVIHIQYIQLSDLCGWQIFPLILCGWRNILNHSDSKIWMIH
jgi:hypothetical protein